MSSVINRAVTRVNLAYARYRRGMTLGVRAAIFDASGHVFLVRHGYVSGWHMPGGGVDPGETMVEAVRREVVEEGAIAVADPVSLFGIYLNMTSGRDHVALYICRSWEEAGPPVRNMEIVDSGFFPQDGLPEETTGSTRRRLAEIAAGSPATETW